MISNVALFRKRPGFSAVEVNKGLNFFFFFTIYKAIFSCHSLILYSNNSNGCMRKSISLSDSVHHKPSQSARLELFQQAVEKSLPADWYNHHSSSKSWPVLVRSGRQNGGNGAERVSLQDARLSSC